MSILDKKAVINSASYQHQQIYKKKKEEDEYETLRKCYFPILRLYQDVFLDIYFPSDLDETNKRLRKKFDEAKMSSSFHFANKEDLSAYEDIILSADYPTDEEMMKAFLKEVLKGKLEFMCRLPSPADGISPLDRLKKSGLANELANNPLAELT